jgi:hypothetical protein
MRKLLFLDVDGVLNDMSVLHLSPQLGLSHLQNLKMIVAATQCEIVLSSTWRFFPESKQELSIAFEEHAIPLWIDQTPQIRSNDMSIVPRRDEIILWLKTNHSGPAKVMVIDDDDDANITNHDMNDIQDGFAHTSMDDGLTADHALEVIQFFS